MHRSFDSACTKSDPESENHSGAPPDNPPVQPEQGRIWIRRGDPDCVHYWVGTGERDNSRERFTCRHCAASMTEPLRLLPIKKIKRHVPPGFSVCDICGNSFHWSRVVRSIDDSSVRICLECLQRVAF